MINLAKSADRRDRMAIQFDHAGVVAEFFPAVDARKAENAEKLATLKDYGPWGGFYTQDKACTLSHLEVLKAFVQRDEDYCLVLEDDVFLSNDLEHWLSDMSWWPEAAKVVKLERWRGNNVVAVLDTDNLAHLGRRISRIYTRHSGGAGYIVSREGAQMILAHAPVNMPIDHLLFNVNISKLARSLNLYQVDPALVVQGNEPEAAPSTAAPLRNNLPETIWLRELRRAWHELKIVPKLLIKKQLKKVEICKIKWVDRMNDAENELSKNLGSAQ